MRHNLIASLALVASLGFVAACSHVTGAVSSDVAAAEQSLTTAERLALVYTSLPRCGGAAVVCSAQASVDRIKSLDQKAYVAVHDAMDNRGTLSVAIAAISAFTAAIPH